VMWQLSESIDGMAEACVSLELPVIGGNVSLYNESGGSDIDPTPVMGLLGVVDELVAPPPGWNWGKGDVLVLVGERRADGERPYPLGGSRWATKRGRRGGVIEDIDHAALSLTLDFVVAEIATICAGNASDVTAVHDVGGEVLRAPWLRWWPPQVLAPTSSNSKDTRNSSASFLVDSSWRRATSKPFRPVRARPVCQPRDSARSGASRCEWVR